MKGQIQLAFVIPHCYTGTGGLDLNFPSPRSFSPLPIDPLSTSVPRGEMHSENILVLEESQLVELGQAISRVIGWIYFTVWSVSFYPQLIQNYRRRSVTGLAVDFFTINVFGFIAYSISTACMLFSSTVRDQYAAHHPSAPIPSVRYNDLAFGLHALFLASLTWLQLWAFGYTREPTQKLSSSMLGFMVGSVLAVILFSMLAFFNVGGIEALDIVYSLSYVKILISLLKYIPQALLNYRRKSTVGWSIEAILCDLTGGVLSLSQLILDSTLAGDVLAGTFGNPLKFGLGVLSLFFDSIFLTQHFWWYRENKPLQMKDLEGGRRDYGSFSRPS